jgi:hypothetical protein
MEVYMKNRFLVPIFVVLCIFFVVLFSMNTYAQPSSGGVKTLPEVTLPPPPSIPGTESQEAEDGTIVTPRDQINEPAIDDIDSLKGPVDPSQLEGDLHSIKPPPIPRELLEEPPPTQNTNQQIDINEPAEAYPLPSAEGKPWFFQWWFISVLLIVLSGVVIFAFRNTSIPLESSEKESILPGTKKDKKND